MMPFILNLLDSGDVVMVLSQLLLVAQAVIPVPQLLIPARTKISTVLKFQLQCSSSSSSSKAGITTMHNATPNNTTNQSFSMAL